MDITIASRWVEVAGRPARVEVVGEGDTVLLVGSAVPMAWSRPGAVAIAELGYRVINFDYEAPDEWVGGTEFRSCLKQGDDVVSVMDLMDVDSAVLVGVSRGAITAYAVAALSPRRVKKLVLAFPVAGFTDTITSENQPMAAPSGDPMAELDTALDQAFSADYLAANRQIARDLFLSPPGTVGRVARIEEETVDHLPAVPVPTLVMVGHEDAVIGPEHPERLLAAIPGANSIGILGASHSLIMEQPGKFVESMVDFLER